MKYKTYFTIIVQLKHTDVHVYTREWESNIDMHNAHLGLDVEEE